MSWHVELEQLDAYVRGDVHGARSMSIESHVTSCAACRAEIDRFVEPGRLDAVWSEITDELDRPRRSSPVSLLVRLGVREHVARLLAAVPSLHLSWLLAMAAVLAFGVAAAHRDERGLVLFLVLAPLLPVAGVAAAYAPPLDPVQELTVAAPFDSFRLLLLRSTAVVVTTVVLVAAAALALPGFEAEAAAWLLPALALTVGALALSSALPTPVAFGAVAVVWVVLASVAGGLVRAEPDPSAFGGATQAAAAAVAVLAIVLLFDRRDRFDLWRTA